MSKKIFLVHYEAYEGGAPEHGHKTIQALSAAGARKKFRKEHPEAFIVIREVERTYRTTRTRRSR